MFIKVYQFKVKKELFDENKKINKSAAKIYSEYSGNAYQEEVLIKRKDKFIKIMLLDYYSSKSHYQTVIEKVNGDERITMLYKHILRTLYDENIIEEDYES